MCHVSRNASARTTVPVTVCPQSPAGRVNSSMKPLAFGRNPFRKVAKSARVNLNRYWGILSQKYGVSSSRSSEIGSSMSSVFDFSEEEAQNRMNEMLEAQANAEEQNSINSQIEASPEYPRRMFVRQRSMFTWESSSVSSFAVSSSSAQSDDSTSQDSVFI